CYRLEGGWLPVGSRACPRSLWRGRMPDQHRIQLAQAAPGTGETAPISTETHAGQVEEHYKLGDIPDPAVLFANGILDAIILVIIGLAARRQVARVPRGIQNFGE